MSITNRLSLFFMAALAVVLVGFSATMYGLARRHLHTQLDRHRESAMHLLIAAIEVHPDDVEWEPLERKVTLGDDPDLTQVRWVLQDEHNKLIDCSANLQNDPSPLLPEFGSDRRIMFRRVKAGQFDADIPEQPPSSSSTAAIAALPADRTAIRASFIISVVLSEKPLLATLANLAFAMTAVSIAIWCVAAAWGRWLCKQALLPIFNMAEKARSLQKTPDSLELLDVPPHGDELTELGRSFNQLLVTLRDAIDRQQRFAGDASHQLRTPLTAMLAAVDVAARHERSPEEYRRVLAVVQRRGRDLQQIVEILLALTRRNLGSEALESELLDLNAWCRDRLELWQSHPRRGDFDLQLASTALWVRLQPTLLGQVFDNLLDNACKYSAVGSPITIKTRANAAKVILSVEDQGPGISSDDLKQVFEPFFRAATARCSGEPGFGLGLTVARQLASVFSGTLEVESSAGQGSSFCLVLPLSVENQPLAAKASPPAMSTYS